MDGYEMLEFLCGIIIIVIIIIIFFFFSPPVLMHVVGKGDYWICHRLSIRLSKLWTYTFGTLQMHSSTILVSTALATFACKSTPLTVYLNITMPITPFNSCIFLLSSHQS